MGCLLLSHKLPVGYEQLLPILTGNAILACMTPKENIVVACKQLVVIVLGSLSRLFLGRQRTGTCAQQHEHKKENGKATHAISV